MPKTYKQSYSKKKSTKKYVKKSIVPYGYRKYTASPSLSMLGRGFPMKLTFKHKYVEQVLMTDGGGMVHYQFRANGMYDPNITQTGTRPLYYNTLIAVYNHYTVIGSKIKYTIVPTGTTVQVPYKVISFINDDSTTSGGLQSMSEYRGSKVRVCQGGVNPDKIIVTNKWSAKKTFGGSVLANDDLRGNASGDPTEQSVFQLTLRTLDQVSSVSVHVLVEIEYIAVWRELKDISAS